MRLILYGLLTKHIVKISFMLVPLSYFSIQPVLHDWCNKGRGMCYPLCWMMHIKESLLLIAPLAIWMTLYHMSDAYNRN